MGTSPPSEFGAVWRILLLWLVGLGTAAQFAKFAVPFGVLQDTYPTGEVGWLLTLISLCGAILGMSAGVFVAHIGTVRAVVGALVLGALCSAVQASLPALWVMFASRLVEGFSHLLIVVAAPTLIAGLASDRWRGPAMALWSTFFGVSFALTAFFGLPIVERYGLGSLVALHGAGLLGLAAAVAVAFWGWPKPQPVTQTRGLLAQHFTAYRSVPIITPAAIWLFYTATFVSLLAVIPLLLPQDQQQIVVTLMPLVSIPVALVLVSALLQRLAAARVVILGFLLSASVAAFALFGVPLAYVAVVLFATLGLVQGAAFAMVPELNETQDDRALANGVMAQAGNVGNLLGTPVMLTVIGLGGSWALMASVVAIYLAGALVLMILLGQIKRR